MEGLGRTWRAGLVNLGKLVLRLLHLPEAVDSPLDTGVVLCLVLPVDDGYDDAVLRVGKHTFPRRRTEDKRLAWRATAKVGLLLGGAWDALDFTIWLTVMEEGQFVFAIVPNDLHCVFSILVGAEVLARLGFEFADE